MKKSIAVKFLILSAVLMAAFMTTAVADVEGDWKYAVSGSSVTISRYTGSDVNVVIPDDIGEYPVTAIASRAFENNTAMETVLIPQTVNSIGTYAFSGCTVLQTVEIPYGVTGISGRAFMNCSGLASVVIPDSVSSIATGAFSGTALKVVRLPEDIDTVGNNAFPSDVLLLIETAGNSMTADAVEGVYDCIEYNSNGVDATIHSYKTTAAVITVPETVNGLPVTAFDSTAFGSDKKLIADLSGMVAELLSDEGYIFYDSSDLTMGLRKNGNEIILAEYDGTDSQVTIPSYIDTIGGYAFNGNNTVAEITIPATVSAVESNAFTGASVLADLYLPDTLTSISTDAFPDHLTYWCTKTSSTAKALGNVGYSFIDPADPDFKLQWYGSSLWLVAYLGNDSAVTIPNDIHEIGKDVFRGKTSLTTVTLPSGLTKIHAGAFLYATNLNHVDLPETLTTIETLAFSHTGIQDIDIPDDVSVIRGGSEPLNLASENYDDGYDYPSLPDNCMPHATYHSTASHALSDAGYIFYKQNDEIFGCRYMDNYLYLVKYNGQDDVIDVPEGIEGVAYVFGIYNQMTGVNFPSTLKIIGYEAFKNCSGLTSITIPTTVIEIGYEAFAGSALRSIRLPDNVQRVGYGAFMDCTNLASATFVVSGTNGLNYIGQSAFQNTGLRTVAIPTTTVSIGSNAFSNSTKLSSVTLPANGSLTSIGSYAFSGTSITTLTVPGTVKNINEYAFSNCNFLETAALAAGVQTIGYGAFQYDYALQKVTLNTGLKTIGESVFYSCSALSEINIPNGVTSIGTSAFYSNSALHSIVLPNTVTSLGQYAFAYASLSQGITLSTGLTTIDSYTFEGSQIRSISIPNNITSIGIYAFASCSQLTDVTLSSRITSIGTGAFSGCSQMTWVELPGTMTRLNQIFQGCSSAIVVLPDSITYIHGIAFNDVRAVLGSRNNDLLKSLDRFGFSDERSFVYTYINDEGIEDYDTLRVIDYIGSGSASDILPNDVKIIKSGAFTNCLLTSLQLPDSGLTTIETNAFNMNMDVVCTAGSDTEELLVRSGYPDMYGFTYSVNGQEYTVTGYVKDEREVSLPSRATAIGDNAFLQCIQLTKLILPDSGLTSIGSNAFHNKLQVNCTFGSATYQLLVMGGYPVEVDGYPGLYAVASNDGKLYMASYKGTANVFTLPDNIASINTMYHYNELTGESSFGNPFPTSTSYVTSSFETITAQTFLSSVTPIVYITVPGKEEFGYKYNQNYYVGDGSSDIITLGWYYGSDKDLVLPDSEKAIDLDNLAKLDSLTLGNGLDYFFNQYPSCKVYVDPTSNTVKNGALHLKGRTTYNIGLRLYSKEYPDFVFSPHNGSYGDMLFSLDIVEYNGSATSVTLTGDAFFHTIREGALPEGFVIYCDPENANAKRLVGYEFRAPGNDEFVYTSRYISSLSGRFRSGNYSLDPEFYYYCIVMVRYLGAETSVTVPEHIRLINMDVNGIDRMVLPRSVIGMSLENGDNITLVIDPTFTDTLLATTYDYLSESHPYDDYDEKDYYGKYDFVINSESDYVYRVNYEMNIYSRDLCYDLVRYSGTSAVINIADIPSLSPVLSWSGLANVTIVGDLHGAHAWMGIPFHDINNPDFIYSVIWDDMGNDIGFGLVGYSGTDKNVIVPETVTHIDLALNSSYTITLPDNLDYICLPGSAQLFVNLNSTTALRLGLDPYEHYSGENYTGFYTFSPVGYPDFHFQSYGDIRLISYTGGSEVYLPAGYYDVDSDLFTDVTVSAFYIPAGFYGHLPTIEGVRFVALDRTQLDFAMIINEPFYLTEYTDIRYRYEETGKLCFDGYEGIANEINLPSYIEGLTLTESSTGKYDASIFGYRTLYVYPNTVTAQMLDRYGISYNAKQTVKSILPAALTVIEEEAFMNCAFNEVTIGSHCTSIGARAFANSPELVIVHIPLSVCDIDETAFSGCSQLTIYGAEGSAAETFAVSHQIRFVPE